MGDISSDTSMEDILASIKRIIAEEGEPGDKRADRRPRSPSAERGDDAPRDPADAVLELREAVAEAIGDTTRERVRHQIAAEAVEPSSDGPQTSRTPEDPARDGDEPGEQPASTGPSTGQPEPGAGPGAETILSTHAAAASRGQLETLSRMIVKPDQPGSDTLEGMVREMLRPMLRDWLDANLPSMVERMVAKEISRITERDG
ncbi:DUF2497 domain-containing protein [Stakelama saccharophila]|uniref:DUF2497 domain-containing protein n=1 Tax=Stakelama saccharophila TaxID=3075605 RepID=A0ABZ0B6Z7_9SPHN|nr:DUF2497 domain-containing protein [Stakelama sp. W311]WNO52992.1 DUF2497 domain-containing protein [Stakelama sp. W311]